ncbi:MAG: leucine-rich repeat domain-containing protein [Clostridia bacterium]|nr:leucine-rich repeat domain-containing protein [Clostridia bacterium]
MAETSSPRVLSDREMREWIPACPVQVKRVRLVRPDPESGIQLTVTAVPCGDFAVDSYTADIDYQSDRRESVGQSAGVVLTAGESAPVPVPFEKAVYASILIKSVRYASGEVWENADAAPGKRFPEQAVVWQTDPLYEAMRRECAGVTEARYWPDEIDGAWRCACGQINLASAAGCGSCGVKRAWLAEHLDRDHLTARASEAGERSEREIARQKKHKERELTDRAKAIGILSSAILLIALILTSVRVIVPTVRYNHAVSLAEAGEYDDAIAMFRSLGKFRDAAAKAAGTVYEKAKVMTGLDEVYMTDSSASPWFSITEDGILSFRKDKYEDAKGSWAHFVVPDMVDGVIVRELDRNFFLNCSSLAVVTISDCVEVLGEQAFYNCESLHTVHFGANTREIGPRCFINCPALEEIEIPDQIERLGLRAFNKCTGLKKVVLGRGIREIGAYTFSYCTALERITILSPLASVGEYAFSDCDALSAIYCRFPADEWTEPVVGEGNEIFLAAEKHFE